MNKRLKKKVQKQLIDKRKNSPLLVNKKGQIQGKNFEKYVKSLKNKIDRADYYDMIDKVKSWGLAKDTRGKELSLKSLISQTKENKREKMFINAGITLDEAAKELGANRFDLLNESLWDYDENNSPVFKWNNQLYIFTFTYEGSVWTLKTN